MLRFGKLEEDVEVRDGNVARYGTVDAVNVESADTLLMPLNQRQLRRIKCWKRMVLYLSHLVSRQCIY